MNVRDKIAHQLGLFFITGLEQEAQIEALTRQLQEANQRLADARADERTPSGATSPPDQFSGS